jgi:hypothetical protein
VVFLLLPALLAAYQEPLPLTVQKLSARFGGLASPLRTGDQFGRAVTSLGDLDLDGVTELAVGAHGDDDGGTERGTVWLCFLARDGSVRTTAKLPSTSGGLTGLAHRDEFGRAVGAPGDLDGDGVPDLIVGAPTTTAAARTRKRCASSS